MQPARGRRERLGGVNYPGSNNRPGATSWMFPNAGTGSTTGGNNNSLCGGGMVPTPFG